MPKWNKRMPTRMIRDWTDSTRFERLSAEAERLFVRLIMKADDYGRFHGDPRLVKAACFPLLEVLPQAIDAWTRELCAAGLLVDYSARGVKLLAIVNFSQRLKQSRAKFPPADGETPDWMPMFPGTSGNFPPLPGTSGKFPPYLEEDLEEKRRESEGARAALSHPPEAEIPTFDEVKAVAAMRAVPFESAKSFFDHHQGNNLWLNPHGRLIDWRHKLTSWAARDRVTGGKPQGAPAAPPRGPSLAEVTAYGEAKGIPADFCRRFHRTAVQNEWRTQSRRDFANDWQPVFQRMWAGSRDRAEKAGAA